MAEVIGPNDDSGGDRKKPKKPYKEGNTLPDGSYAVGKNKPADHTKFRENDGRKRGRRAKDTKNLDTDVMEEASAKITINEGGKTIKVTKQRATVKTMFDKAFKGDVSAMREALDRVARAAERKERSGGQKLPDSDRQLIDEYLADRAKISGDFEAPPESDPLLDDLLQFDLPFASDGDHDGDVYGEHDDGDA